MNQIRKEKINLKITSSYEYPFEVQEGGLYLIEIIASAKSWWQNLVNFKSFFKDDDLAIRIDEIEFPKLSGKSGLFDGEAAWNGNNLKGLTKIGIFIVDLGKGEHALKFFADQHPILDSIAVFKITETEIIYVPEENNTDDDGNGRQWLTIALASLPLKNISIKASAKNYPGDRDDDDLKFIIDGNILKNETDKSHKNWYWCGRVLNGGEKEFSRELNLKSGLHYIELWADRSPALSYVNLTLDAQAVPDSPKKRIPTVDDPEWTGNFDDDTEKIILARAIFGEARSLSKQGKIAVGWSIKNRVNDSRWGDTYHEVILERLQYSAFNESDRNFVFVKNPLININQKSVWYECYEIAGKVMEGKVNDSTDGANHYFSDYIEPPYWTKATNAEFKIKIDNTLFYELKKTRNGGFINVKKLLIISVVAVVLLLGALYVAIKINNKLDFSEKLSGAREIESYKHFFLNPKSGEVTASHFNKDGEILRTRQITDDGHLKRQLNVFMDSELMGYLQYSSESEIHGSENTSLMIKENEYDDPREVYRTGKSVTEWNWLDKKHADVIFSCGTGCQNYYRIDIDTKKVEEERVVFSRVSR